MRKSRWTVLVLVVLTVLTVLPATVSAAPPSGDDYPVFICPAHSTHNPNGTWVLGAHGAYYVNIIVRGQETNPAPGIQNKVFVKVSEESRAVAKAQIPAGYALYKDVFPEAFANPNMYGYDTGIQANGGPGGFVVLLGEGIANFVFPGVDEADIPAGWDEFDMATVTANGDGTYNVTNIGGPGGLPADQTVTINPVPLAAGVFW